MEDHKGYLKPTMKQLRYLREMEDQMEKYGKINGSMVSRNLELARTTVHRFIKECEREGMLLPKGKGFTAMGQEALDTYKEIVQKLYDYFAGLGVPEERRAAAVTSMFDGTDYATLQKMCETEDRHAGYETLSRKKEREEEAIRTDILRQELKRGVFAVEFTIYRKGSGGHAISMADKGFAHPATLHFEEGEEYLELKALEVEACSRAKKGLRLSGHVLSVRCRSREDELIDIPAGDGRVRIPLHYFSFKKISEDEMSGQIELLMTCSVGEVHMPESFATLVVWL